MFMLKAHVTCYYVKNYEEKKEKPKLVFFNDVFS